MKRLLIPSLFIAAGILSNAPVRAQQYKLRQSNGMMGMKSESTIYVKGMRKRTESVGMMGMGDPLLLEYAASQNRVIVTHDRNTMTAHAQDRMKQGLRMAGLIVLEQFIPIGKAIQEVGTLAQAGDAGDLDGQILFLS